MSDTSNVLAGSSLVVSTVTAAWFSMMPDFDQVTSHTPDNKDFNDELRHREFMVVTIAVVFAAVVTFYLKDPVPLILCGATLALLLFAYEKQYRTV